MNQIMETDTVVNLLKKLHKELQADSVLKFIKCWLGDPEALNDPDSCVLSRPDAKGRMRRIDVPTSFIPSPIPYPQPSSPSSFHFFCAHQTATRKQTRSQNKQRGRCHDCVFHEETSMEGVDYVAELAQRIVLLLLFAESLFYLVLPAFAVWRLDTIVGMLYHGLPMSSTDTNIMVHTCSQELCVRPQHIRFRASSVALVIVLKALAQAGYSIIPPAHPPSSTPNGNQREAMWTRPLERTGAVDM
ncbi:unnamed protein product [Hymenolepis diminuta]|uniref:Retrotransposon protein n=1 Tax=Hymenolepis diminuta TaxID=6216 RepID=A0A0R3SIB4_HYMDI|nr:unnamed protein product [Hymenolepis diminuta]